MRRTKSFNLFFISLVVFVLILSFLMILPFWKTLFSAAVVAFFLFPIYNWLNSRLKHPNLSASLMLVFSILFVVVPFILIINGLTLELVGVYRSTSSSISGASLSYPNLLSYHLDFFGSKISPSYFSSQVMSELESWIFSLSSKLLMSVPALLFHFFVFLFALFFFFRDGKKIVSSAKDLLEIDVRHKQFLEKEIAKMTHAVIYGSFASALAQSLFATLGFYLFGVSTPLLWGVATFFVSLLPIVGPPLVWFPLALLKLYEGYVLHSNILLFQGFGLLIYGFLVVSWVDNLIRPRVVSSSAEMSPLLILISVIGGIAVFGFVGIFAGPLIIVLFVSIGKLYLKYHISLFVKGNTSRGD